VTPVREVCEVLDRRRAGAYQVLTLVAPEIAAAARPGQFVGVLAGRDRSFLLRRPFSIHRVERPGVALGAVQVVFDVVGPGTRALAALRPHEEVDVLGPLGRPFAAPDEPVPCLLVGGGYGTAPLFFLAEELRARHCRVDFLIGAGTAARLLGTMQAKRLGHSLTVTTDDGTAGQRGVVTDPLPALLDRAGSGRVYACGPMPMLAAVSRVAARHGLPCQVAVEEQMACGTGICFSCVVPVRTGGSGGLEPSPPADPPDGPTRMARSCLEGPVLDGAAVAWAELGYADARAGPELQELTR
jgi:dihydroorotate dehydrogenase electron transfer subunit